MWTNKYQGSIQKFTGSQTSHITGSALGVPVVLLQIQISTKCQSCYATPEVAKHKLKNLLLLNQQLRRRVVNY